MSETTTPASVDLSVLSDEQLLTALHEAATKASDTTERLDRLTEREEDLRGEVEDGHLAAPDPRIEAAGREDDIAWGVFWAVYRECDERGLDTAALLGY